MTLQPLTSPWDWVRWATAYGVTMLVMAIVSLAIAAAVGAGETPTVMFGVLVFCLCWAISWTTLYLVIVAVADGLMSYFAPPPRLRLLIRTVAGLALVAIALLDPIFPLFVSAMVTAAFMAVKIISQTRQELFD